MSSSPTSSANDKVINVDLGLNIFGLSLFLVCFVALLLKYKFKIDPAAIKVGLSITVGVADASHARLSIAHIIHIKAGDQSEGTNSGEWQLTHSSHQ